MMTYYRFCGCSGWVVSRYLISSDWANFMKVSFFECDQSFYLIFRDLFAG